MTYVVSCDALSTMYFVAPVVFFFVGCFLGADCVLGR